MHVRGLTAVTSVLLGAMALALPAPAAALDPVDPGTTQEVVFDPGGRPYPYIVYTPTTYDSYRPTPLLVMVHGCQTTAEEQMRANLYNPVAEREGFIVMYPDVDAIGEAQPGPANRCWKFPDPASWHRDSGDAAALAGMTRAVIDGWNVDRQRVYLMGMSAGGFMTSIMAAAYPDLYAAVGIMAAGAYADAGCIGTGTGIPAESSAQLAYGEMGSNARVVPRLVMGGDADQGVPPACADKALLQGLRTDNLVLGGAQDAPISLEPASVHGVPASTPDGYPTTVSTYRDPAGCVIGERWLIHGMNHFWSGGSADPQWANFTDPRGPSGAEASWEFFERFSKDETAMPCAEADRFELRATPETAKRGKRTRFRFTAIAFRAGREARLAGKSICLAGKCTRTGKNGRASLWSTLPQAREYGARLRVGGEVVATATIVAGLGR